MVEPGAADLSHQLLQREHGKAERRLALVRVVLLLATTLITLAFTIVGPPSDHAVQVRATLIFGAGTCFAAAWWWSLERFGVFERAAVISSTHDFVIAAAIVLNWSIYPGGELVPTQLQFGVGFGILLSVIVLTAIRFDYRVVLVVTAECVVFYLGLALVMWKVGAARFVMAVNESYGANTANMVDIGGRITILLVVGAMLAYLTNRVYRLLQRSVHATEQRLRLRQFISTNVVEAIESGEAKLDLSGRRQRIAVLFCDIRGFTALSETLEPEALLALLNAFYERAAGEVFRHGGTLDKYIGDGFMALFGAPTPLANPSEAALSCGLALLEEMRHFTPLDGQPLRIGVGIHTDEVVVGNLGTESYKSYTAIGRGVNVASRIESATARSEASLLFSEAVRADLDERWSVEEVGRFELKGIAEPQVLYTASQA